MQKRSAAILPKERTLIHQIYVLYDTLGQKQIRIQPGALMLIAFDAREWAQTQSVVYLYPELNVLAKETLNSVVFSKDSSFNKFADSQHGTRKYVETTSILYIQMLYIHCFHLKQQAQAISLQIISENIDCFGQTLWVTWFFFSTLLDIMDKAC